MAVRSEGELYANVALAIEAWLLLFGTGESTAMFEPRPCRFFHVDLFRIPVNGKQTKHLLFQYGFRIN